LKVELRIEPELEEPYAIIYAPEITAEIQDLAALLAQKSLCAGVLAARRGDRIYFISTQQVEMIRAENGSICMYDSTGKKYELEGTLQALEGRLGEAFIRIGKSVIVNLYQIDHVIPSFNSTMGVRMKNKMEDYISRKYLPQFKERLGM
jgi:DNA-binding LytR/AlgR family response regulator